MEAYRKRKGNFGSAEKDCKYTRDSISNWYFDDHQQQEQNRFEPQLSSSNEKKSWAEMMDEEDEIQELQRLKNINPPKSRRKIPLEEIATNSSRKTKPRRRHSAQPKETDERKLSTRQRQIDIGKNTPGYQRYLEDVAVIDRTVDHPWTPDKFTVCSTRSWQGVMRIWRRKLHFWDPPELVAAREDTSLLNVSSSTYESDVPSKSRINSSIEREEYISSEGSQASSLDDQQINNDYLLNDNDLTLPFV